ncbi:MAG: topoisomerase protein [Parcubacteria group bacterium GW2011_GWA2_44_12]|nr:MAG: topoisomerase protein [Parcubacteria group bacterium GW2011_GWA2_44_12]
MNLVIVESPTKAKTISKFLPKEYLVESSFGHIRDLPKKTIGVDVEHDFSPNYQIPADKKGIVGKLQKAAKNAEKIFFATDEDREGEAIAWHLDALLSDVATKAVKKRITFHEVTKSAIAEALKDPRELDINKVDAQQARRILDRLVGYELSPFLWKKVARGLSAGRVQSVAVRLVVEREREIEKFVSTEYWSIAALLYKDKEENAFEALLKSQNGKAFKKFDIKNKEHADGIINDLENARYEVQSTEKKERVKYPPPPFTTSTLQIDAYNKFGYSAKQTMMIAQQLYEGISLGSEGQSGLITYMRTDSLNLAEQFLAKARDYINQECGQEYLPKETRRFKTKAKTAQEAHEAIRPTDPFRAPEQVAGYLDKRQGNLYRLIWQRTIASQMQPARYENTTALIDAKETGYTFQASGLVLTFDGFLKLYPMKTTESLIPELMIGKILTLEKLKPLQHFTQPPPRYTDATLVKALEEQGIGRPSTYAPTLSTILARNYVARNDEKKFMPTEIGTLVNDVLVQHFPRIVDYEFTAKMEDELDLIARGGKQWVPVVREFYDPFKKTLNEKYESVSKKELTEETTDENCEKCGKPMVIKMGRFGKFLSCSGFPECKTALPLKKEADELLTNGVIDYGSCEKCGKPLTLKRGAYGPFLGCSGYPECKTIVAIEKKTGVACNKCKTGDIIEKKSKRGKIFFACNNYPECKNALWSKPTGALCEHCESLMVYAKNEDCVCSNKECGKSMR